MSSAGPLPKVISDQLFVSNSRGVDGGGGEGVIDHKRNVALIQWAQFIEHDLVKTVVRTMGIHTRFIYLFIMFF